MNASFSRGDKGTVDIFGVSAEEMERWANLSGAEIREMGIDEKYQIMRLKIADVDFVLYT